MDTLSLMQQRRTIRRYSDRAVDETLLNRLLEAPWKVLNNRSELNAKEWMYKWIYMWSRAVDFPLGGWARGVVLHYRSITGKHFVWFENEEVPSSWFYLNGQYIVVEGINNEYE